MQKLKYFSGIKPTVEYLEFEQEGKERAVLDRQREMFSGGVVNGLELIEEGGVYSLQPGVGYAAGERIEIAEAVAVEIVPTGQAQYLFLKHQPLLSHPVQHFVTGEVHNIHQSDGFAVEIRNSEETAPGELLIAEVSTAGIIDRRQFVQMAVDGRIHPPNSDTGTTAPEFRVGIGQPNSPEGLRVLTESPVPKPPLNVRITAIKSDWRTGSPLGWTPEMSKGAGKATGLMRVFFAWDWRDIIGESVASDTFRIDNAGYSFEADQLKGYYLTFSTGEEFLITGNEATAGGHTLVTVSGDLNGLSATTHPASIHPGVTEYRFTAIPVAVDPSTPIVTNAALSPPPIATLPAEPDQRVERTVRMHGSPVASSCMLRLPLGAFYVFQVQSVRYRAVSQFTVMGAGTFNWKGQQIPYSYPFLVALPSLGEASLSLEPLADGKGFIAAVDGWDDADLLEYGWMRSNRSEGESVDFDNPDHHPEVSASSIIKVLVLEDFLGAMVNPSYAAQMLSLGQGGRIEPWRPVRNSYLFAARPLIGGQVVGVPLSARITLEVDPHLGQTALVSAIGTLTRHLDGLNKTVRNLDTIRQAQAAMVEDQLLTLNSQLVQGQQYQRFDLSAHVNLPFPDMGEVPLLMGEGAGGTNSMSYVLEADLTTQTFTHNLGHRDYVVQVRDAQGSLVGTDVALGDNDVTISLTDPMPGTLIIIY